MRIRLGDLRRIILREVADMARLAASNEVSPGANSREQLGHLVDKPVDVADDPDEMSGHLREPAVDPDDCWGPVPPTAEDPYLPNQDPFARDTV